MTPSVKKILWQIPALLVLSFAIGILVNHLRPESLVLMGDWSADARLAADSEEIRLVSPETAEQLFVNNRAVFLDARSREEFEKGHIKDALNLPWYHVEENFMDVVQQIPPGVTLITYCDGEACHLSHELAKFLKSAGFQDVRVLLNGWTVWLKNSLPCDRETV